MARVRVKNKDNDNNEKKMRVTQPVARNKGKATNVNQRKREKVPYSIVICRGKVRGKVKLLKRDIRKAMLPYTDFDLKEGKENKLQDFLSTAGPYAVTHFLILGHLKNALHLRVAKARGPTLSFEIRDYALAMEMAKSKIPYRCPRDLFNKSPLMVMSGFHNGEQQLKLTAVMFQSIFPAVDLETACLSQYQRLVLLNYDSNTKLTHFRHYSIKFAPTGVSSRIKSLMTNHKVPNLENLEDVGDFLIKNCCGSDGKSEDGNETAATANPALKKSKLILQEIGPRMSLHLVKIEEGLCMGTVLFKEHGKKATDDTNLEGHGGANLDQ